MFEALIDSLKVLLNTFTIKSNCNTAFVDLGPNYK